MHRRTFEVLAKYISHEYGVTVHFDQKNGGAKANVVNDTIHMPENISGDNALAALALLMHEAAHLKYTKYLPLDKILKTETDKIIHNVIEDVRIDLHNFRKLSNIKEFYRQLYKKCGPIEKKKAPLKVKAMIACIDYLEGFRSNFDKDIQDIVIGQGLANAVQEGSNAGDYCQHHGQDPQDIVKAITKIKKILKIDDSKEPKLKWIRVPAKGGKPGFVVEKGQGEGEGEGGGKSDLKGADEGRDPGGNSWGEGTTMEGASAHISDVALEEQTIQAFKELLCLKERREVYDGNILNTDELMSYFTGDMETLFKDETIVKTKKSKIMFLMDCSGSMGTSTIDYSGDNYNTQRVDVVASCVKKIISVVEEVRQTESLDVDWAVSMFDGAYTPLTKESWEKDYGCHGGTTFHIGMEGAINDLMDDYTIEGKRIIVAFSDGEVGQYDIDLVKAAMQKTGNDIRYLVIGVGCMPGSPMTKGLIGDRVILGKDDANVVLLDTLKDLIE